MPYIRLLVFFSCLVYSYESEHLFRKLPHFLKVCHRSDPNLDECVKESVQILRPYLVKGIPEFGIPPCEPLLVPEILINQGKGPVVIQSTYKNIHITGASQFIIRDLNFDLQNGLLRLKLWFPFLHMISDYDIDGKILILPISGSGVCEGNNTDIEAFLTMKGEQFQRGGQVYFHVSNLSVQFKIEQSSVRLNDLFDGNKALGNTMNSFINDNWELISKEIQPVLEDTLGDMFRAFANNIFHKYPIDMLLPP